MQAPIWEDSALSGMGGKTVSDEVVRRFCRIHTGLDITDLGTCQVCARMDQNTVDILLRLDRMETKLNQLLLEAEYARRGHL